MKPIQGYHIVTADSLHWRLSNLMSIPNADYLERTGSENLSARLWRLPPKSANTLHKHIRQEEFYFVLEGTGRIRIGEETLTIPKYGAVLVGPDQLRQVFNDTDSDVLWLIVGAPEELELLQGSNSNIDLSHLSDRSETTAEGIGRRAMAANRIGFSVLPIPGLFRALLGRSAVSNYRSKSLRKHYQRCSSEPQTPRIHCSIEVGQLTRYSFE